MKNLKAIDRTVSNLCDEIDYWQRRTDGAEKETEYWKNQYNQVMNQSMEIAKTGVANALMFALSVTDNEKGDLVISAEKRKELAKNLK